MVASLTTVDELLRRGIERLRAAQSETARLDAEVLLAHALRTDRTGLLAHPEAPVGDGAVALFEEELARRATGEPVAYIRGFKEFFGLAFATDSRALIPRPETERLVELAVAAVLDRLTRTARPVDFPALRVADVGTGSGAVVVALAVQLRRRGVRDDVDFVATDASSEALQLAVENAVGHSVADRIQFVEADLLPASVDRPFDVVVANLPYIPSAEVDRLPIAASFEPRPALDGGPDGLSEIARLLDRLPGALAPEGVALLEIGSDQEDQLRRLLGERLPEWRCDIETDLAGSPRVARVERPVRAEPS